MKVWDQNNVCVRAVPASNDVVVSSRLATGSRAFQQNDNVAAAANWVMSGDSITTANGPDNLTTTPSRGIFFLLANP